MPCSQDNFYACNYMAPLPTIWSYASFIEQGEVPPIKLPVGKNGKPMLSSSDRMVQKNIW